MAALDPAVAAVRVAVRGVLAPSGALVACSGGPDSMALAQAAAFVGQRLGTPVGLVTVDHQLQAGSAERARAVAEWGASVGLSPSTVATVVVDGRGGPEAAARDARYAALVDAAVRYGRGQVLLGHTRDDQAETVLLALVRGGGLRGVAAMPRDRSVAGVTLTRPLLDLDRAVTHAVCARLGLPTWHDPHNVDPSFGRTHARSLIGQFVAALGPGVVANLARTAEQAGQHVAVVDALASTVRATAQAPCEAEGEGPAPSRARIGGLRVEPLALAPVAVRRAVLRGWLRDLGVPGSALTQRHLVAVEALVVAWRGQGTAYLPGGHGVVRRSGVLHHVEPGQPGAPTPTRRRASGPVSSPVSDIRQAEGHG